MDIAILLPFIVLIGAMFLMTRSAKKKQQQAVQMRDQMQSGTGVRTIGGMYARVEEVGEDTVLLEISPGLHARYAKNAIGAVLEDDEFDEIVNGVTRTDDEESPVVPDDASSLTGSEETGPGEKIDLGKDDDASRPADSETETRDGERGEDGKK